MLGQLGCDCASWAWEGCRAHVQCQARSSVREQPGSEGLASSDKECWADSFMICAWGVHCRLSQNSTATSIASSMTCDRRSLSTFTSPGVSAAELQVVIAWAPPCLSCGCAASVAGCWQPHAARARLPRPACRHSASSQQLAAGPRLSQVARAAQDQPGQRAAHLHPPQPHVELPQAEQAAGRQVDPDRAARLPATKHRRLAVGGPVAGCTPCERLSAVQGQRARAA